MMPRGLGGQELLPGRAGTARRGIDPGIMQDFADRGGRDRVAEPDQVSLHPPVPVPPEYSIGRLTCRYWQPAWRCDGWLAGCP